LTKNSIDINKFLRLIEAHQIESIIYSLDAFRNFLPENEDVINFKYRVEYRSRFNMVLLDELVALNRLFKAFEFPIFFYKGVMLCKLLFDDFTTRTTADIDILIDAKNFDSMRKTLLNAGYEEVYFYPANYADYYLKVNREASFRKKSVSGKFIFIELHWAPLPSMFGMPFNNDYFFTNSRSILLMGERIPIINLNQHLLILLLHHGISDLWRNLKHIFDIATMTFKYRDELDWKSLEKVIKHWHFEKNAKVGLELSELLFGIPVPVFSSRQGISFEADATLKSLLQYPLLKKEKKSLSNIKRQLLLCDSFLLKIQLIKGYLWTEFMPSMIDLKNQHFPKSLFPLYYITKRFRFLYKRK
jgi:hypothetical protein